MTAAVLSLSAAVGVHLLYSALVLGRRSLRAAALPARRRRRGPAERRLLVLAVGAGLLAAVVAWTVFGGGLAPSVTGALASTLPAAAARSARGRHRAAAMDAWPRLLEELRIRTGSLGRSVPQALIEVGRRAPDELIPAFRAAEREWLLSTDFGRALAVLKAELADPTADAAAETLLVAHEVGGADLDRRLQALIEDRTQDMHGRKDARARQAGARFARCFVLAVPAGMALVGLSLGTGRAAYQTTTGQVLVAAAVLLVAGCWVWSGRIMALPEEQRVFDT